MRRVLAGDVIACSVYSAPSLETPDQSPPVVSGTWNNTITPIS